jgi:hypothetical protein
MLERIFPRQFDNAYRGQWLAIGILALFLAVKFLQGTMSVFNTHDTAINADGIPLDTLNPAAVTNILSMFRLLGLNLMAVPLLGVVVLLRYRAMVPFLYLFLLLQGLASRAMLTLTEPPDPNGMPTGAYVNLALLGLLLAGFVLSVTGPRYAATKTPAVRT